MAAAVFALMLAVFNANGREIGSYDSRPVALAAREMLLRGTLGLNHVVGATPEYANRWGVVLAKDGRYRSVYSPVSALEAAALTWPFWRAGLIDIQAPLAPALMAKGTASVLVSLAVAICYVTARRFASRARALAVAIGLGLGTGLWSAVSQTLWQSETAVLGLAVALLAFTGDADGPRWRAAAVMGVGLSLAGLARPQLAPAVAVLAAGAWWRWGWRAAAVAGAVMAAGIVPLLIVNVRWFGHPLGALPLLESVNASVHGTGPTFGFHPGGPLGLLFSPSRGLIVFSPIVLVAAAGIGRALAPGRGAPLPWCAAAIAAQFGLYASYSVWWGGHTYGPRYMLDLLPLMVPLAAAALAAPRVHPGFAAAGLAALAWSIAVAATGAFCYPHDVWNADPTDVDRDHRRLWSLSDNQIQRCWKNGPSPQNFALLDRAAIRQAGSRPAR